MLHNYKPQPDVENWSETRFLSLWQPEAGVGVFLHVGRLRGHIDWWWSQVAVYLPDGRTLVDRQWGRDTEPTGHRNGNLTWLSTEPDVSFEATFDGICEPATPERLATGRVGAGSPAVPVSFRVRATARTPRWYMHGAPGHGPEWAGDSHTEQSYTTAGTLTVGDTTYSLDGGFCLDDHSSGVRQFEDFGGDDWLITALPEGSLHSVEIFGGDERTLAFAGAFVTDSGPTAVREVRWPAHQDLLQRERRFEIVVTGEDGSELPIQIDVLGYFVLTITQENHNLNGAIWDDHEDPIFFIECPVKLTMPDGAVSYGHIERSTRQHNVDRDTFAIKRVAEPSGST